MLQLTRKTTPLNPYASSAVSRRAAVVKAAGGGGFAGPREASPDFRASARRCAMNARVDHLLEEIFRLPTEERSAVATALIDSLEDSADSDVKQTWRDELLRRREDLRRGRATAENWSVVRARLGAL